MNIYGIVLAIIGVVVAAVIAFSLLPTVFTQANTVVTNTTYKSNFPAEIALVSVIALVVIVVIILLLFETLEHRD